MSILTAFGFFDWDTVKESIGRLQLFDIVRVNLPFLFPFLSFINVLDVTKTLNSDAEKQHRRCWKQSNTNQ